MTTEVYARFISETAEERFTANFGEEALAQLRELQNDLMQVAVKLRDKIDSLPGARDEVAGSLKLSIHYIPASDRINYSFAMDGDALAVSRSIFLGDKILEHELFELSPGLRHQGINGIVEEASAAVIQRLGLKQIVVSAGLSDGGYVWLRKGYWPTNGKGVLERIAFSRETEFPVLTQKFLQTVIPMTEKQARAFVVSDAFREYKIIFAGSSWEGYQSAQDFLDRVVGAKAATATAGAPMLGKATANELLEDAVLRHQTYLLRYADGLRNKVNTLLNKSETRIAALIREKLRGKTGLATPTEVRRLQSLQASIAAMRQKTWSAAETVLMNDLKALAKAEPLYAQTALNSVVPVVLDTVLPSAIQLAAIATSNPFQGAVTRDWAKQMAKDDLRRIQSAVQLGMTAGESSVVIARRVVGSGAVLGADGVTEMTRRQLTTVVRTSVSHIANQARQLFYNANADILKKERFVATLDSRTSPPCRALDGEEFPVGQGPIPPIHYNCRSTRVPVLDNEVLGNRPELPFTHKQLVREYAKENGLKGVTTRADLPRGHKGAFDAWKYPKVRAMVGQVPARTTYEDWIKRQSAEFQNDTLGVKKAKLFRSGKLGLDKFVSESGRELSLEQLEQRYPAAFK